jgi:tRNA (guanine-N7-)-methyltransferase
MHGYTLGLLHGEGHEVLYANHNVYVNEGSPESDCISNFYENNIWKLTKQLRIFDLKLKNSAAFMFTFTYEFNYFLSWVLLLLL